MQEGLQLQFAHHAELLDVELLQYTMSGGRLCLTKDAWSARSYTDYAAITVRWINSQWQQRQSTLDVVHLSESFHTRQYLAEQLL